MLVVANVAPEQLDKQSDFSFDIHQNCMVQQIKAIRIDQLAYSPHGLHFRGQMLLQPRKVIFALQFSQY